METPFSTAFFEEFFWNGALISLKNNHLMVLWGDFEWKSEPDACYPSLYFPDFFLTNPTPWLVSPNWLITTPQELLQNWPSFSELKLNFNWQSPYKSYFHESFCDLKLTFSNNKLKKAVPYIFEILNERLDNRHLKHILKSLLIKSENTPIYLYGFWSKDEGILGGTPELLFKYGHKINILETVACAGTSSPDNKTLSIDPKQLNEHRYVVEGIEQSLSPFGKVTLGKLSILKLRSLSHLVTPIEVELNQTPNFSDIVKALHPTPALGAYPKLQGWDWLKKYQLHLDRKRYGAPIGYSFQNENCCYVAIRNLQWDSKKMYIGAGCGIVEESEFEEEWQEICLKLQSIKDLLAL